MRGIKLFPDDFHVQFGIHGVDRADGLSDELQIEVEITDTDLTEADGEKIEEYSKHFSSR